MHPSRTRVPARPASEQRPILARRATTPAVAPTNGHTPRTIPATVSLADILALEQMLRRHEDQRDLAQIQEVRDRPANEQFLAWDGLAMSLGLSGARPTYELVILPTAFLELAMLPTRPFGAVAQAIHTLSHDSHPPMAEALGSSPDAFRLLVAGYRVLYAADEEQRTVQVIDIARDQRSC